MRIIAGSKKGQTILTPEGQNTRPTLDRVKESLFGILQFELPGAQVLDLFAGSGNLGLEALSRGAAFAVFCDRDAKSAAVIRKNIEKLGFERQSTFLMGDYAQALGSAAAMGRKFDIVFLDPPYQSDLAERAIELLLARDMLSPRAIVTVEHELKKPPQVTGFSVDTRKYGYVGVSILRREATSID